MRVGSGTLSPRAVRTWIARRKRCLAAIAAAKRSQQFGREEEKE